MCNGRGRLARRTGRFFDFVALLDTELLAYCLLDAPVLNYLDPNVSQLRISVS